jgi:hypothetical protein
MRAAMTKAVVLLTMDADELAQITVPARASLSVEPLHRIKRLERVCFNHCFR